MFNHKAAVQAVDYILKKRSVTDCNSPTKTTVSELPRTT